MSLIASAAASRLIFVVDSADEAFERCIGIG